MFFSYKNQSIPAIRIGDVELPEAMEFKFLGIWFDSKLKWQVHIDNLLLKIKCNSNLLRNSKNFLNKHALFSIYFAHIYSHLTYGMLLWGNMATKSQLNRLQKVQNKCVSFIMNKRILTKDYKFLKLLTIDDMIWLHNVKLGHRLRHSHLLITISNLCRTDSKNCTLKKTHDYATRYKKDEIHPMASSKDYETSYLVKVVTVYNDIPESFKKLTAIPLFDRTIKSYHFLS